MYGDVYMHWSAMYFNLKTKLNLFIFILFATFIIAAAIALYYRIEYIYEQQKKQIVSEKQQEIIDKVNLVHRLATRVYQHNSRPEYIEKVYREKLTAIIQTTASVLTRRYELRKQQGVADNEIQAELKDILRHVRYDNGENYIFAYNLDGVLASHPDPKLNGKNGYDLQDAKGFYVVRALIETAQQKQEGFVHYYWNKLENTDPKQKITYIKLFKPYNWVLATGIYIEDTEATLKQQIADLLTAYRYDLGETKNNYLFVIDEHGETIKNPAFPELNGQNILNIKDATGHYFIRDFIQILQEKTEGFVKYYWARPEYPHEVSEKLTFVKTFEPFNWVISTGIYLEDIGFEEMHAALEHEAAQIIWNSVLIGLALLLIGSLVSMGLIDILVKPLVQARHVARNIAKGDFSQRINYKSKDEMGQLTNAINSMAQQLQESFSHLVLLNQEKDEFLGIAAHDLKNPLQAIQGSAELIGMTLESEKFENKKEVLEFANMINISAERMFDLITNLLDVNAIEAGKVKAHLQLIDITPILQNVMMEYTQKAQLKQIEIHYIPDATYYQAWTDMNLLRQVLDNLVSNAVKYSPFNRQIFIRIKQQAAHIQIAVQDQGEGLSQTDQEKLFGKFTRLSTRPTDGEHSTGLGLFIVKKLMHSLQGEIQCESELGKGSTFIITIPTAQ